MSTIRREIHFEGIPPEVYPQRNILLTRWQRDNKITFWGNTPWLKWGGVNPQRDNSLSRWQRDDKNFSLRVDPPLQFCSKLLYIYYKLWGISWLNQSKIFCCQRDNENFFWGYTLSLDWIGSARISLLNPWKKIKQQEEEISFTALKSFEALEPVGLPASTLGVG